MSEEETRAEDQVATGKLVNESAVLKKRKAKKPRAPRPLRVLRGWRPSRDRAAAFDMLVAEQKNTSLKPLECYFLKSASKEVRLNSHYLQENCAMSFKTFLVGFSGLAISSLIGCSDEDSSPTRPISAENVDTNVLATALCLGECEGIPPELVFDGVLENGDVKTGRVVNDDVHIVEFTLAKDAEVIVTVDGEYDILFVLLKVIYDKNGAEFAIVGYNDDDDESPINGYSDRSQRKTSLKKGRYLVGIGTYDSADSRYRLQVEWM